LLLLDGFTSHIEYKFVKYAEEYNIILFSLPPHTSHLLQPLNIIYFQPYKHYHSEAIDEAIRIGDTKFSKIEFLAVLKNIRRQTFKQSTILSAFRRTDIVPFDPKRVLAPLRESEKKKKRALSEREITPEEQQQ
jgi:DDE superfamily endonuclease